MPWVCYNATEEKLKYFGDDDDLTDQELDDVYNAYTRKFALSVQCCKLDTYYIEEVEKIETKNRRLEDIKNEILVTVKYNEDKAKHQTHEKQVILATMYGAFVGWLATLIFLK